MNAECAKRKEMKCEGSKITNVSAHLMRFISLRRALLRCIAELPIGTDIDTGISIQLLSVRWGSNYYRTGVIESISIKLQHTSTSNGLVHMHICACTRTTRADSYTTHMQPLHLDRLCPSCSITGGCAASSCSA